MRLCQHHQHHAQQLQSANRCRSPPTLLHSARRRQGCSIQCVVPGALRGTVIGVGTLVAWPLGIRDVEAVQGPIVGDALPFVQQPRVWRLIRRLRPRCCLSGRCRRPMLGRDRLIGCRLVPVCRRARSLQQTQSCQCLSISRTERGEGGIGSATVPVASS